MNPAVKFWLGAVAGAAAGALLVRVVAQQGFWMGLLPGVLAGWGASYGRCRGPWPPVAVGAFALAACVLTEWWVFPWIKDGSLLFFLQHLGDLPGVKQVLLPLGGVAGYFLARDAARPHDPRDEFRKFPR